MYINCLQIDNFCQIVVFFWNMNKLLLALAFYALLTIANGQPTQKQCQVSEQVVMNMANLVEKVAKGEGNFWVIFWSISILTM